MKNVLLQAPFSGATVRARFELSQVEKVEENLEIKHRGLTSWGEISIKTQSGEEVHRFQEKSE